MKKSTGALILAAGVSDISKTEMLRRELDTLREAGVSPVAAVTGHDEDEIRRELVHRKVIFVVNPRYKTTKMFTSIKLGLEALKGQCERVVIVNSDIPSFSKKTVAAISSSEDDIVFPIHDGRPGHPFCVHMDSVDMILSYDGRDGIPGMIKKGLLKSGLVEVDDPGIHMEANEEKSLREILRYQHDVIMSHPVEAQVSISLARGDVFFDDNLALLLHEIGNSNSMNTACKNLNMAYSRGWKMIRKAEEMLGFKLLTKQVGGASGGGSMLTEKGNQILDNYDRFTREVKEHATDLADRYFRF